MINDNRKVRFVPAPAGVFQMIFSCLLLLGLPAQALSAVTASYQAAGGRELVIRIEVGAPPPSSLILIQKLPPGTGITHAEPPVQKMDPAAGEAKWLFRSPKPGTITVSLTLDREVSPAEISGQIRFKSPGGEVMQTLPVR